MSKISTSVEDILLNKELSEVTLKNDKSYYLFELY